jgi:drug/metabolite transporter (DMT)-like permease
MSVLVNYVAVIFIWSTTPLAIKLSNSSASPFAAVMLRMLIAFFLASACIALWHKQAVLKKDNWKMYSVAALSIFPNMPLVYLASNYMPSGLIAVLFALTPLTSGLIASCVLKEKVFNRTRLLALSLAIAGLWVIYMDQIKHSEVILTGLVLMFCSNLLFLISQIGVKHLQKTHNIGAFEQTFGALAFSLPGLMIIWWVCDGVIPTLTETSGYAIVYLAVVGSLVGFAAYFSVLSQLPVLVVSVIPLMTPALALWLGALLLNEPLSLPLLIGTAMIVLALALYDGVLSALLAARTSLKSLS